MRNPEQNEILGTFLDLLSGPTGDGGVKRAAGVKPFWKVDESHWPAAQRHISAWQRGELVDVDSSCHPLAHAAWRLLAIAHVETEAERSRVDASALASPMFASGGIVPVVRIRRGERVIPVRPWRFADANPFPRFRLFRFPRRSKR